MSRPCRAGRARRARGTPAVADARRDLRTGGDAREARAERAGRVGGCGGHGIGRADVAERQEGGDVSAAAEGLRPRAVAGAGTGKRRRQAGSWQQKRVRLSPKGSLFGWGDVGAATVSGGSDQGQPPRGEIVNGRSYRSTIFSNSPENSRSGMSQDMTRSTGGFRSARRSPIPACDQTCTRHQRSAPAADASPTRRRIPGTAIRLFVERGFDQVTIAEAAEVSVNTVCNYYDIKEDLVLPPDQASPQRLAEVVRQRRPDARHPGGRTGAGDRRATIRGEFEGARSPVRGPQDRGHGHARHPHPPPHPDEMRTRGRFARPGAVRVLPKPGNALDVITDALVACGEP